VSGMYGWPEMLTNTDLSSSVTSQTTGPQPVINWFLHLMRSRASSFKWEYPLLPPLALSL
jgi:hypothetical protein